jgi:TPR repeat protein
MMNPGKHLRGISAVLLSHAAVVFADEPTAQATIASVEEVIAAEASSTTSVAKPEEPGAKKFWAALVHFRSKASADLAAGRAELEAAAADEFTHAQLVLGEYYQTGTYGFPADKKKSANYYHLAAERGNAFAKVSFGLCLFSGVGVRKDTEKAAEWLSAALRPEADFSQPQPPPEFFANVSAAGVEETVAGGLAFDPVASAQARAHYILGVILESAKKPVEAQAHYVAAANAGVGGKAGVQEAAQQAAVNYAFGRGVPRDPAKASEMLAKARTLARRTGISMLHNYATAKLVDDFAVSELEEAVAKASDEIEGDVQLNIARQFTDKKSKDYNPREAVQWFELAAESGRAWAMLELALLYSRGELGQAEPEKAFKWFERVGGGEKPKHYLGVANLVICYENGIGTPKDPVKAREIATRFKDDDFVCYLALRGDCPTTVLGYEQVVELTRKYAERKDPQAQFFMGWRCESGFGAKRDLKAATAWYKKAAKVNHGPAARQLALLYRHQFAALGASPKEASKEAIRYARIGAEAKDALATAALGLMTAEGWGVRQSEEQAKQWYEASLSLDPKLGVALNNLAVIYEQRFRAALAANQEIIATLNRTMMLDLLKKADDGGYDLAAFNLGRLHHEGILGSRDFTKAYNFFEKAAERGNVEASFSLGRMHEAGEGVAVSSVEAAYHYRLAALANHAGALNRLVAFYREGKGGSQDLDRAQFWLMRLAGPEHPEAIADLADIALQQKRYPDAIKMLEMLKAKYGGDGADIGGIGGTAYERLSRCYRDGLGVKKNTALANEYLNKAVELRNPDALCRLAKTLIARGDVKGGLDWFGIAARRSPAANFALGQLYYFGQGVPVDRTKAGNYLRYAASRSFPDALYFLAVQTYKNETGAPELDEAIQFAISAEAMGFPNAALVREKLEQRRRNGTGKS